VVVYGATTLVLVPGILRDPLMYDLGVCLIPVSFVVMAILGGGLAMAMKKFTGLDLRGRLLEMVVVTCTMAVSLVSWGLVKGFFGDVSSCRGDFGEFNVPATEVENWYMLHAIRKFILRPGQKYYGLWDSLPRKLDNGWFQAALCSENKGPGCFEYLPKANADFFLAEEGGAKCAADLMGVAWLHVLAALTFVGCFIWKQQERQRRRQGRRPVRGEVRFHQD
jgi:hypothetical protein